MAGGMDRPYFRSSIAQLELLFSQARADPTALQAVDYELSFRSTERAAKLRAKVTDALKAHSLKNIGTGNTVNVRSSPTSAVVAAPAGISNPSSTAQSLRQAATPTAPTTLRVDLGELRSRLTPQGPNEPASILAAWIALEALSPQTYRRSEDLAGGDRRCVADLSNGQVPWGTGERSRPKKRLYYQIILGAIPMDRATEDLVRVFGENEERSLRIREKAAIGAILIDKDGVIVEENGISVSSFAWALPLALKLNLGALSAWPKVEPRIIEKLDSIFRRVDKNGNPIPVDLPTIDTGYRWLVAQFGLPTHLVEPPTFALRVYHYFKSKNPPEASLLNSFFLHDLIRGAELINQNAIPAGLRRYLRIEVPKQTIDLLADKAALEQAIAPAMMPPVQWPSPNGHPLVMLQQAAVNLARSALAGSAGLIAINGPPGTGKTTLLRDIVASCTFDRALAMVAFEDPEKAFIPSGKKMSAGENAFFQLYALNPSIKGHEILVASSNNKAVENISKELPDAKAIGRSVSQLNYFKSVSDLVHGTGPTEDEDDDDDGDRISLDPIETWGMIAAVLGNAKNRAAFQQSFWWHDDRSFRLYLKAAKGDSVVREIKDTKTGKIIERRTPSVVITESPPSPSGAKSNWRKARERFLSLKREIDGELKALEDVRQLCRQLAEAQRDVAIGEAALTALLGQKPIMEAEATLHQNEFDAAKSEHSLRIAKLKQHRQIRPGFVARLFGTEQSKAWSKANIPIVEAETKTRSILRGAEQTLSEKIASLGILTANIHNAETHLTGPRKRVVQLSQSVAEQRRFLGDRIIDAQFFGRGHQASNLAAPWLPESLHRKREELFISALAVHRAFIDASAQKVLHNLSVLMDVLSSGPMQDETKRKLIGDLWSTLFLVVPVISTTFASVDRMIGYLPAESIGWLLIDEAGQALPQAAVGAIMRAKRSIVVGDPLQIPPVVTLPELLNSEICKFFKIDKPAWAAPEASAQTLADAASKFQATFRSNYGPRRVGIPLLVHRRCQEPMFGISNRIAYDSQMVYASGQFNKGNIGALLGPSRWLDIDGDADSKWCPAEGEVVVGLLKKMAHSGISNPDLFIITPFRIVAQELRRRIEREQQLFAAFRVDAHEWVNNRVGTIHTVQGREADSVILVLGAPKASQNGARMWAAGTPNILNVAVSRAKQNLYVIGSYGAWSGVGHAREIALSIKRAVI